MLPSTMFHKDKNSTAKALSPRSHIMYRYVRVYCCVLVFCFLHWWFFLGPLHVFVSVNHTRIADHQNVTLPASTAPHKAISSAQVAFGIIKPLVAPNHGPHLSASFTFCCMLLTPPAERSLCTYQNTWYSARGAEPLYI